MASWPWSRYPSGRGIDLAEFPKVKAWVERVGQRPAVLRALPVPAGSHTIYVGEIQASNVPQEEAPPLVYWNRGYRKLRLHEE